MTNSTTNAIDWTEAKAETLKVGDRFRLKGRNAQGEIEVFTIMDIVKEPWICHDNDQTVRFLVETKTQKFWFQDSDIVLVRPLIEDWQETEAQNLRPGSRFRLAGTMGASQHGGDVFTVVDVYEQYSIGPVEKLFIETASQDFGFDSSDIVLVVPSHQKTVTIDGAYFYAS